MGKEKVNITEYVRVTIIFFNSISNNHSHTYISKTLHNQYLLPFKTKTK